MQFQQPGELLGLLRGNFVRAHCLDGRGKRRNWIRGLFEFREVNNDLLPAGIGHELVQQAIGEHTDQQENIRLHLDQDDTSTATLAPLSSARSAFVPTLAAPLIKRPPVTSCWPFSGLQVGSMSPDRRDTNVCDGARMGAGRSCMIASHVFYAVRS